MSFLFEISLALFMLKKRREQRIHVFGVLMEVLVHIWCRKITSSPTSPRIRTSLRARESLTIRTRPHRLPTSRRRLSIRRKDLAMCAVIRIIGLLAALNALISVDIETATILLMLLLVILR
jgi:hypothetical protein